MINRFTTLLLFALIPCGPLLAEDEVFARQGDQVLTQAELDAAFTRIPPQHRLPYIRDGGQVDRLVQSLLRYKQVAADAGKKGYPDDPVVQLRLKLAMEEELAKAWIDKVLADAPVGDYEALAHEYYLGHPEELQSQEAVDVSHLLVKSDNRPEAEALETANRLYAELQENPAQFDEYVLEYSEDPAVVNNKGRYPRVVRGQMVKPFEDKAFSMQEPGSISEPVKTAYGYHIIRLNKRMPPQPLPFDQVRQSLVQKAYEEHMDTYRRNYILRISDMPIQLEEGAVEKMVKRHFGENLELAPDYYKQ